jgi:hypothetical protein
MGNAPHAAHYVNRRARRQTPDTNKRPTSQPASNWVRGETPIVAREPECGWGRQVRLDALACPVGE